MNKDLLIKFGKRIKSLREQKGFTQDELSYRAEIGRSTLGNIETAQNDVTLTKVDKIAKAFGMTLCELFNYEDSSNKE